MAINVWWVVALFVVGPIFLSLLAYRLRIRWLNALTIRLLIFFFAVMAIWLGLGFQPPPDAPADILILDVSDSINDNESEVNFALAQTWLESGENRQLILFGEGSEHALSEDLPQVSGRASDLLSVLVDLPSGMENGTNIAVASDGNFDHPVQTLAELAGLQLSGVGIIPIGLTSESYRNDAYIESIQAPEDVWEGMKFWLQVSIEAESSGPANLEIFVNGELISQRTVSLATGQNRFQFPLVSGTPGVMAIQIFLQMEGDEFEANNNFYKAIRVLPWPSVLLVTSNERQASQLGDTLKKQGFPVRMILPSEFPTAVSELTYSPVVMIHNVLAQDFSAEQIKAINQHVVVNGKSLIFLGGNNSFTLGGYQDSDLAELMPVTLAPPARVQRVPITFLLVLDRSGSMAGDRDSEISPIELTREGAMRAIEALEGNDYLGVLSFSATLDWNVEIGPVGSGSALRAAQDDVSQIPAAGGTFMFQALQEAISKLRTTPSTEHLHILLMSDGVSGDGSGDEFDALVRQARSGGITISTIALGRESDPERLSQIAELGGGRYYQVLDPLDLPSVMISETRAVQAENVQKGEATLAPGSANHPVASELAQLELATQNEADPFNLPQTDGYIAVQSKTDLGAEDIYISNTFGDPLLSTWQVGLGRTAAWMGDLGEHWSNGISGQRNGIFWELIIRDTLPDPSFGEPDIEVSIGPEETALDVLFSKNEYHYLDKQAISYKLVRPEDNLVLVYPLTQIGHRRFQAVFPTPDFGAHAGVLAYQVDGIDRQVLVPVEKNYPTEWQFSDPGEGNDRMNQINPAREAVSFEEWVVGSLEEPDLQSRVDWYTILLVTLVFSWPLEIAARRWNMPWRRP